MNVENISEQREWTKEVVFQFFSELLGNVKQIVHELQEKNKNVRLNFSSILELERQINIMEESYFIIPPHFLPQLSSFSLSIFEQTSYTITYDEHPLYSSINQNKLTQNSRIADSK